MAQWMRRLRPFLYGMGSVFDIFGTQRDYIQLPEPHEWPATDEDALRRDWLVIANDMQAVLPRLESERA